MDYIYHPILTRQSAIDGGQKDGEQQARGGCFIVDNQIRDYRGSQSNHHKGEHGHAPGAHCRHSHTALQRTCCGYLEFLKNKWYYK